MKKVKELLCVPTCASCEWLCICYSTSKGVYLADKPQFRALINFSTVATHGSCKVMFITFKVSACVTIKQSCRTKNESNQLL